MSSLPLPQDLIVIGRWPDPDFVGYTPNEKRTIDIFDANTGNLSLQLFDGTLGGIISLNKFSNDGQFLCSGESSLALMLLAITSLDLIYLSLSGIVLRTFAAV